MSAAPAEPGRTPDTMIYPQGSAERGAPPAPAQGSTRSWSLLLGALVLGAAGVWMFIKRRQSGPIGALRGDRKIVIEETKSLGNRQYLVVAAYEGKQLLLGVTPGQIQLLTAQDRSSEDRS